jgi:hypothetical protein
MGVEMLGDLGDFLEKSGFLGKKGLILGLPEVLVSRDGVF